MMTQEEELIKSILEEWGFTSTWRLGHLLRLKGILIKTPKLLRMCKKLEKSGLLKKHFFTSCNNTVWELVIRKSATPSP
jgi:hypothetical protein